MHNQRKKALRDLLQTYCTSSYRQQSLPKSILIVYMQAQNSPRCTNALSIDSVFRFPTTESQKFNPPANKKKGTFPACSIVALSPEIWNKMAVRRISFIISNYIVWSIVQKGTTTTKAWMGWLLLRFQDAIVFMQYLGFFQLWSFMPKGLNCTIILSMYWNNTTYTPTPLLESLT